jgi:hypothetical protein
MFFSANSEILEGESTERVCLPFQILVLYFKNQNKGILDSEQKQTLRSVLLKSLRSMCKDSTFAEYIAHDSDFIDIFMQMMHAELENLPLPII